MKKEDKNLSIIIYSCYKNRDMWSVFSKLFNKYWNDCKYKVYLLTDKYEDNNEYIFDEAICIDSTWACMIKHALNIVNTPYVMLFMDDYLLTKKVDNDDIDKIIETAKIEKAADVRICFSNIVKTYPYEENKEYDYLKPGSAYSMSTHIGVWDADFLKNNIKDEWSAWDFERVGSMEIVDYNQPILQSKEYIFPYVEGVRQGTWLPEGINVCKHNYIELDYSVRCPMSIFDRLFTNIKGLILKICPNFVISVQNAIFRKK